MFSRFVCVGAGNGCLIGKGSRPNGKLREIRTNYGQTSQESFDLKEKQKYSNITIAGRGCFVFF